MALKILTNRKSLPLLMVSSLARKSWTWRGKCLGGLPVFSMALVIVPLAMSFCAWVRLSQETYAEADPKFQTLAAESDYTATLILVFGIVFSFGLGTFLVFIHQRNHTINRKVAAQTLALRAQRDRLQQAQADLHQANQELEVRIAETTYQATHDALTGLLNRPAFHAAIAATYQEATGIHPQWFAVLVVDLDRFKEVNDTFGHAIGDKLITEVAGKLTAFGPQATVARLGGDEFAILLLGDDSVLAQAEFMAADIIAKLSVPFEIHNRRISIGASIGIALGAEHGDTAPDLVRNANAALQKAKSTGRGRYRVFDDEIDAAARQKRMLELGLRTALDLKQFSPMYQPVVDLKSGRLSGVETLLRWSHPQHGSISPTLFVPLLEESGQIVPVGQWIMQQACKDAWRLPDGIRVAVNVSPVQLSHGMLYTMVVEALQEANLAPNRLEIEVTETVLLGHDPAMLKDLHRLQALGITIALDDFGTGYSSFSYLRIFPFNKIKIDKSFIDNMGKMKNCDAIVSSIIGLAKGLNAIVTAEGIETDFQALRLKMAGCSQGQGFYFGEAKPIGAFSQVPVFAELG